MTGADSTYSAWEQAVGDRCKAVEVAGRWRRPLTFDAHGPVGLLTDDGRSVVAFASNDYLGLSSHPAVIGAAHDALDRWGTGAGASRLVTGSRPVHHELEAALSEWKGTERAVVFPTGFAANLGVMATFGEPEVLICSDQHNHASIVDGARLARARVAVYRHADAGHLDELLANAVGRSIVVTDLVFSMDGDDAPLASLADVCRRHGSLLILDEAHAVLSPDPTPQLSGLDVLRVGTLSKTLGSMGGFVAGPRAFIELLENVARSYIFTTAPSPADMAAALAALQIVTSSEGADLRRRLSGYVQRLAPGHDAPIIPVIIGSESDALGASEALFEQGLWVPAIRPPSVPAGTSRLRVTLSAAHTEEQVDRLGKALAQLASLSAET